MSVSGPSTRADGWSCDLSGAVLALGTDEFYLALDGSISQIPDIGNVLIFHYPEEGHPRTLYACYPASGEEYQRHVERYLEGPYILDPFYNASLSGIAAGAYLLREIAPDDFHHTEFYRVYYKGTGLKDELSLLQPLPDNGHLHLSVGYTGQEEVIPEAVLNCLMSIASLVNALLLRHWQLHASNMRFEEKDERIHHQLNRALGLFGSSLLTGREQSILQLVLHGHSNKSAAHKLEIAESTVKLHRKHIYEKLDISSQAELFHLFIDSLSCFNPKVDIDPLQSYMGLAP